MEGRGVEERWSGCSKWRRCYSYCYVLYRICIFTFEWADTCCCFQEIKLCLLQIKVTSKKLSQTDALYDNSSTGMRVLLFGMLGIYTHVMLMLIFIFYLLLNKLEVYLLLVLWLSWFID